MLWCYAVCYAKCYAECCAECYDALHKLPSRSNPTHWKVDISGLLQEVQSAKKEAQERENEKAMKVAQPQSRLLMAAYASMKGEMST